MFTTRNITLLGINHSVSVAPTTVTQTIQTTFQLIYCRLILVCHCLYTVFMQMSANECLCTLRTCTMFLSKCCWLCYCFAEFLCRHKSLASLHSHLFVVFFCRMSFADVSDRSLLTFCAGDHSRHRCWLFSLLAWPCRALELLKCLGNISAPQSRNHLASTWYGHISLQLDL